MSDPFAGSFLIGRAITVDYAKRELDKNEKASKRVIDTSFKELSADGEKWKPAKGFSAKYYVSNAGRLLTTRYKGGYRVSVIKPALDASGYLRTVLDGKTVKVHRVVATTWLDTEVNETVNHINGIKSDNRVVNLEWMSARDNKLHALENGLLVTLRGSQIGNSTLKEHEVREIRRLRSLPKSQRPYRTEVAAKFGVSEHAVKDIVSGRSWSWLK